MLKQAKSFICLASLCTISAVSQDKIKDTIHATKLDEVVVTGQPEPQSIRKSVFNVKVITRDDIERQAANNMADLLNFNLNINVTQDTGQGRSTVSMFGLDGQYLKILVDNVPLVSDTGVGNNIDLTQINLDDIEQIEIIEGSMGVTHGANAVSGIINIITKKATKHKWEIDAALQEETVGSEYNLDDRGRHIQSLKISHNISENWFVSVGGNRNDFAGFVDDMGGEHSTVTGDRGYRWRPKEQYVGNGMITYKKNRVRAFYKFDYFHENIDSYDTIVNLSPNYPFQPKPFGNDRRYITERQYHHLNSSGHLVNDITFNISASYQKQNRDFENYRYFIEEHREADNERLTYQSTEILYSTGSLSNILNNKKYNLQVGYELVNEKGFASAATGIFKDEDNQPVDRNATLSNYDVYSALETAFTERFSGRAGARYSFQNKFDNQYAASVGLRYLFDHGIEARTSLGKSYRSPNFDELYTYMVDANHDVQGNEDLVPEESISIDLNLKKTTDFASGLKMTNSLMTTYIDVTDRISLVQISFTPLRSKYINTDSFKMLNFNTSHQFEYNNLSFKLGAALVSTSQKKSNGSVTSDDSFLWAFQLNSSLNYVVPKWDTDFSLFYKLNGREPIMLETVDENNNSIFAVTRINSFSWMDATVRKRFLKKTLEVTVGARNILDITNTRSSLTQGATMGHGGGSDVINKAYGRSYFVRLAYNLNL
ncbi:TonB-dependent receptor [Flavobacterium sp. Sd200]|uniref:TonB-dependent receptor plug domain-containing protein n=1 Tax=Flavobacterium sp. Sd200 TaxID=2692211 RepID=UPI00137086EB|nr:TonB-dependent receptor [Flavobacterium sp. Sd200]MXN92683.1 TonB-dependent receptor [Flavobacterium sp. Sd200]